jgi:hypothetical protein
MGSETSKPIDNKQIFNNKEKDNFIQLMNDEKLLYNEYERRHTGLSPSGLPGYPKKSYTDFVSEYFSCLEKIHLEKEWQKH